MQNGTWSKAILTRMQTISEMVSITKKQYIAQRRTLLDAYQIKAQGANDIVNVRHYVSEEQDKQRGRKQHLPNTHWVATNNMLVRAGIRSGIKIQR